MRGKHCAHQNEIAISVRSVTTKNFSHDMLLLYGPHPILLTRKKGQKCIVVAAPTAAIRLRGQAAVPRLPAQYAWC